MININYAVKEEMTNELYIFLFPYKVNFPNYATTSCVHFTHTV